MLDAVTFHILLQSINTALQANSKLKENISLLFACKAVYAWRCNISYTTAINYTLPYKQIVNRRKISVRINNKIIFRFNVFHNTIIICRRLLKYIANKSRVIKIFFIEMYCLHWSCNVAYDTVIIYKLPYKRTAVCRKKIWRKILF